MCLMLIVIKWTGFPVHDQSVEAYRFQGVILDDDSDSPQRFVFSIWAKALAKSS